MGQITDFVKANFTPAEGIDVAEVEKLEEGLDPLKNLTDVDKALDFINRNDILSRALSKDRTQSIEKHDNKFMTEKFPDLLKAEKEKILQELNPTETPEQKRIRELEEKIKAGDEASKMSALKIALQEKAAEIGYTGDLELFMSQGDKAIETLESFHAKNTEYLTAEKEKLQKELYGKGAPKRSAEVPKDIDEQILDARSKGDSGLALKLQMIKNKQT